MELDDHIVIAVPEGGELELQLAGLGSRLIAGATDLIIQGLLVVVLLLVTGAVSGGSQLNLVVLVVGVFVVWFGYSIAFEVLARGRTPGKRFAHLRVVRDNGDAVDLPASAIRNVVRILDGPTLLYVPTVVTILVTKLNQRPGDITAGTLVIRDAAIARRKTGAAAPVPTATPEAALAEWDVSAVTAEEMAAVRGFLARRDNLERHARSVLARRLADGLAAKVAGSPKEGDAEAFLQTLVELKSRN